MPEMALSGKSKQVTTQQLQIFFPMDDFLHLTLIPYSSAVCLLSSRLNLLLLLFVISIVILPV
jgi:hypothetical protein